MSVEDVINVNAFPGFFREDVEGIGRGRGGDG